MELKAIGFPNLSFSNTPHFLSQSVLFPKTASPSSKQGQASAHVPSRWLAGALTDLWDNFSDKKPVGKEEYHLSTQMAKIKF